ncbi:MAG: preprotein translocase subunit SecE [Ruminococcus sp.]|nr:preprotein translocase subunit SecE [Ruminococcus sp.]
MAKNKEVAKSSKKDTDKAKKKGGIRKYFRELRAELKKVVWPSRKQVVNNTGVVMTVMTVMALFLFAVDAGLGRAIKALLSLKV